jgi:hypothetical protein
MTLRQAGNCAVCGTALGAGERAFWSAASAQVLCVPHRSSGDQDSPEAIPTVP